MKPSNILLPAIFICAMVFAITNAVITFVSLRNILDNENAVSRATTTISELDATMSALKDAETGQRGYLLTGDKNFIQPYREALPEIHNHITNLKALGHSGALSEQSLDELEKSAGQRLAYLKNGILDKEKGIDVSMLNLEAGKHQMDIVRRTIDEYIAKQRTILEMQRQKSRSGVVTMYLNIVTSTLLNVFLIGIGYYLINRDLRKRVKSEEKKNEFISVASHELKTPLTSIKAFTQLMARYYRDKPDAVAMKYLGRMQGQVERLGKLVEDLLDVTKIQAGKMAFSEDIFEIDELVDEIIADIQPVATEHQITREGGTGKRVFADRYRLGQVLTNLLTNALKYSPGRDRILVTMSATEDAVEISVTDYGIGIPHNKMGRLFERFYRIDDNERHSFPGLGLGLYISAQIMKRHRGKLMVKSMEGEGSTFTIWLPITLHSRILSGLHLGKR